MKQLGVLFINLGLFLHVEAQIASNSDSGALNPLHPSLTVVIGIILVVLSLTFLLLAYAKFCQGSTFDLFGDTTHPRNFHGLVRSSSRLSGFDQAVIDSLPFFRFSSLKGSKEGLECAVCLSRFEDTEILRLLPKCRHAFHTNCIDQWLLSHSSCPLCRYKFEPKDLKVFTFSNSLRHLENPSNLTEDPNLELFVQREQDHQGSSRFNLGSSFRGNQKGGNEEFLIEEGKDPDGSRKILHKFKHKIIVSDIFIKNRWSDVNSSDLLTLNSEMLSIMSSNKFSPSNASSSRFYTSLSKNENMEKIKVDMEKKRLYESKFNRVERSNSLSSLRVPSNSDDGGSSYKNINNPAEKRSLSEIMNFSRFRVSSTSPRSKESALPISRGHEERIRRLWLPMARRTVQWYAGRERNSQEIECSKREKLSL